MVEDVVRPLTLDSIPGMTQGLEGTAAEGASTLEPVGVVSVDLVEDMAGYGCGYGYGGGRGGHGSYASYNDYGYGQHTPGHGCHPHGGRYGGHGRGGGYGGQRFH